MGFVIEREDAYNLGGRIGAIINDRCIGKLICISAQHKMVMVVPSMLWTVKGYHQLIDVRKIQCPIKSFMVSVADISDIGHGCCVVKSASDGTASHALQCQTVENMIESYDL